MKKQISAILCILLLQGVMAQNGTADASFNSNGIIDAPYETANSICADASGKVLVLGHDNSTGDYNIFVNRYNSNGTPDNSFGNSGRFLHDLNNDRDYGRCIRPLSNGKYLVCGQNSVGPYFRIFLLRLKNNGSLDSSFGSNGVLLIVPGQTNSDAWSMQVAAGGSIYLAGYRNINNVNKHALWKVTPAGALDQTFGSNGEKLISTNAYSERLYAIDLDNGANTIAVAGISNNVSTPEGFVALLDTNGNLKTSFNTTGYKKVVSNGNPTNIYDVSLQSNQVVLAGNHIVSGNQNAMLASLTLNGSLNTGFASGGFYTDNQSSVSSYSKVLSDCQGNFFAGGNVLTTSKLSYRVSKLWANGRPDSTFGTNAHFTIRVRSNFDEVIEAMSLYGDSALLFGGRTNFNNGATRSGIVRIKVSRCSTTGISIPSVMRSNLVLYPNPLYSGSVLMLQTPGLDAIEAPYQVVAMDGKVVYSGVYMGDKQIVLPQGMALSPGVYQLLINVANRREALSFLVQ